MRGKRSGGGPSTFGQRSIPARAGETLSQSGPPKTYRVYPRPCGGNHPGPLVLCFDKGLSPPVRGKRHLRRLYPQHAGSIPARAGETWWATNPVLSMRVYPRPCGGNTRIEALLLPREGLSPPVRGKQGGRARADSQVGSIPARAGETAFALDRPSAGWVYPRPCGGNDDTPALGAYLMVYPRPCGGNSPRRTRPDFVWGLSPPVRGKHLPMLAAVKQLGSIPARAGETRPTITRRLQAGVYPRPCGGNKFPFG